MVPYNASKSSLSSIGEPISPVTLHNWRVFYSLRGGLIAGAVDLYVLTFGP